MGMASGESDIYFGTEVGNWGAANFFLACQRRKKDFFLPLVPTLKKENAQIVVENSNVSEQHEKVSSP